MGTITFNLIKFVAFAKPVNISYDYVLLSDSMTTSPSTEIWCVNGQRINASLYVGSKMPAPLCVHQGWFADVWLAVSPGTPYGALTIRNYYPDRLLFTGYFACS